MELLIITAVQSYENEIKKLLKENQVKAFSHLDVNGYSDVSSELKVDNWFASGAGEYQSSLFYVFVENQETDKVMNAIANFNAKQDSMSHVHAVVVDVRKSI